MQGYIARRLLLYIPTLLLASLTIFTVMRVLPGDVALVILGTEGGDPGAIQQLERVRESLGLKEPLPVQYGKWLWSLASGEFGGKSLLSQEPLSAILARRFPVTLLLATYAILISVIVSIPLGVVAAVQQGRWPDYVVRVATISGNAVPNFWVALVLLLVLVIYFSWGPPVYYKGPLEDPSLHFQKAIWPALVLAWGFSANVTRVTRASMLEVLRQDYVRTARSKGLTDQVILYRHALRNALIPVITLAGLQLAGLLSGTVVMESIFGMPGVGEGILMAVRSRDYPVVQSLAMVLVFLMLTLNLLTDLAYVFIDPRISYS